MHRHAGAFAHGVKAVDNRVGDVTFARHHLTVDVGGNTAHLVVDGGHHGDGLFGDVDVGEVVTNFEHRRQALHDGLGTEVIELQEHVVLVRAAATAFLDFLVH